MKVLVAGATGALGSQLVPRLVAAGHDVTGMTRRPARRDAVRRLGATPIVADALDPDAAARAVARAEPEVIVHQLTALAGGVDLRHFERSFALTNRLRTEGTDHLLAAGRAAGVRRFVIQSFAGWPFARTGGPVKSEDDPLDPAPVAAMRSTLDAIRHLEAAVLQARWTEGVVLRYGGFYGPGTSLAADGEHVAMIRKRRFPVVGSGAGVWSFIHIEDARTRPSPRSGAAVAVSTTSRRRARAKPPHCVPRALGRLLAGEVAAVMMTEVRGASNTKAKRELGWRPAHASWRHGFAEMAA